MWDYVVLVQACLSQSVGFFYLKKKPKPYIIHNDEGDFFQDTSLYPSLQWDKPTLVTVIEHCEQTGCRVTTYLILDDTMSIVHGPFELVEKSNTITDENHKRQW